MSNPMGGLSGQEKFIINVRSAIREAEEELERVTDMYDSTIQRLNQLAKDFPNDGELGKKVRQFINDKG